MLLASIETIHAQLTTEDYAVIKHYPAVERQMVKPKNFSYTSKQGVTLNYLQSSGRSYEVKYDDGEVYTDGVADAWVKGVLKIGKQSYSLYGSYMAEGYLSGVLYDSNKEMFGLLEWQIEDTMTATLKTKKATYNFFFTKSSKPVSSIPKPPVAEPLKPKNDALNELLKDGNYNWKDNDTLQVKVQEGNGVGSGSGSGSGSSINRKYKADLYLSNLRVIDTLSTKDKLKQLMEWGWVTGRPVESNGILRMRINCYARDSSNRLLSDVAFYAEYKDANNKKISTYKITDCRLQYILNFINDAKKIGYKIVEDRKYLYKLQLNDSIVLINKGMISDNEQFFIIEVK